MDKYYTDEKNVQVLVYLLKAHGIKRAVLSPGSSNSPLVASLQYDSTFEVFSCVDERSAAYMACGMAEESGEPVLLSCTGATASRNYLPGLTEAFYRKLPILAVTSTQPLANVGRHIAQVVDRSSQPNDTYNFSTVLPIIKDDKDLNECVVKVNEAILQLKGLSPGPAHINLQTNSLQTYNTRDLPVFNKIERFTYGDTFPKMSFKKIGIYLGSHSKWQPTDLNAINEFCATHNAVVFCDHTSNYHGPYRVLTSLIGGQQKINLDKFKPDLTIHIGEITGDYYGIKLVGKEVWRVNPDGQLRYTFGKLGNIFQMKEQDFFKYYSKGNKVEHPYLEDCNEILSAIRTSIPELPFSNIWAASKISPLIPKNSTVHFGILNSLRSWNFFELDETIHTACNVGGFGIDGILSSAIGASYINPKRLTFCIIGDLAFFYDINSLGNRHILNNLRILLVNNGKGTEFQTYKHHTSHFGRIADEYISAAGHFGNKSQELVKNFCQNLGFEYLSATNKNEFLNVYEKFLSSNLEEKPMVFELFTNSEDESKALELMLNINSDLLADGKQKLKNVAKEMLGAKGIALIKKSLSKS